ncbi:MAG TPA: hypothetical protein VJC04_02650 [Candidatus Paceibacterota bacterium]
MVVQQCKYCGGNVINCPWHPECRLAKLEDLLYRIREQLDNQGKLSPTIAIEILGETFRSKEEIEREYKKVKQKKFTKKNWEIARAEVMQKAAGEWVKENPDPDPNIY